MTIHLLRSPATQLQINEMMEALETYIKLAVDLRREIVAGGGVLHADCEAALLEDGSRQEDVWGADWLPSTQEIRYEALINLQPRQNNPSVDILDASIRSGIAVIIKRLLGGVQWR